MAQTPNDKHRNRSSGSARSSRSGSPKQNIDPQHSQEQKQSLDYELLVFPRNTREHEDAPKHRSSERHSGTGGRGDPSRRSGTQSRTASSGHGTPKKKRKRKKKGHSVLKGIYAAIVVVAAAIVVCYGIWKVALPAPEIPTDGTAQEQLAEGVAPGSVEGGIYQRKDQTYTFLLTCPDQESGNADAIMVVTYDVPNHKVGMLSIPRDTLVNEEHVKINASYHGGIDNLKRVVSDLLGIPIDFTVEINLDGFIQLVDAVGGIDFDVPVEMYYEDLTQDLTIYYQPGMQHLDGQQTMEVCRFRKNPDGTGYPLGDIQRSETIQNVMKTVAKKVVSVANVSKVNEYIKIFQDNVQTNLTPANIAWFAGQALGLDLATDVSGGTLPGDGTVTYKNTSWCYQLYPEESLQVVNELVNPYVQALTLADMNIFTPVAN